MSHISDKTGRVKDSVSYRIIDEVTEEGLKSEAKSIANKLKCIIANCNKDATHRCIGYFCYCKEHYDQVRMFFSKETVEEL